MKYSFSVPSDDLVVIFDVEADEHPPPPAEDTEVTEGSSFSNSITAESSFIAADEVLMSALKGIS